ncbi:MAG: DNA recombination protein RmuC [Candidatus Nanopelagicales bacterium]
MNGLVIGLGVVVLTAIAFVLGGALGWLIANRRSDQGIRRVEEQARLDSQSVQASLQSELSRTQTELARATADRDRLHKEQADRSALDDRLLPLRESVESLKRQAQEVEVKRAEAASQLREQITGVQRNYTSLETATRQLVSAMSTAQSRGQWGEMQLEQLLESSGLVEGINFSRQDQRSGESTDRRPDIVVHLPGGGEIFVDAKFPFDAYWRAIEAGDSPQATTELKKHAVDVLARAHELSGKRYWESAKSPDFVVMFLPLESLLATALDADGDLLAQAFSRNVVLATPTSMLAMLRTIYFGYQRKLMADNAEEIRAAGAEMLSRLETAVGHLNGMQSGLRRAIEGYNNFIGSFDARVMAQARKMKELGVSAASELTASDPLDDTLRQSRSSLTE